MAEQQWSAKIRPELHPAAQELVNIYEATPGSTGPGCCPEALAAVLDFVYWESANDAGCLAELLRGGLQPSRREVDE
jgi:hypothetical protein